MQIVFIGSGTGIPMLHRASPCIMVQINRHTILLDTGPGSLRQLLKAGKTFNDIDIIVYSHFHVDHTADMLPCIFACKYAPGSFRTHDLTIIGHHGIRRLYESLTGAYGSQIIPEHFTLQWMEVAADTLPFEGFSILTAPVQHTPSSIAVRLDVTGGESVVYSGDTAYCDNIITLARGADTLILECSFPDNMECPGHLTPTQAGVIARKAQCRRLVLTHFYPPCDDSDVLPAVEKKFSGEIVLAKDLLRLWV